MAKVFGPALSIDAKGKVGKGVAFQNRPRGIALIKNPVPSRKSLDDPSAAKQVQRNLVKQWVEEWQALPAIKREYWDNVAKELGTELSGYHQFMKAKAIATMPVSRLKNYWPEMMQGLVGYWAFDEGEGGIVNDLSGQDNNGALKPSYPDNCPLWVPGKSGAAGKALSFDGDNDYVDCGNNESLNITDEITVAAWVKPATESPAAYAGVVGKNDVGNHGWYLCTYATYNLFHWSGAITGVGYWNINSNPYTANNWYYYVGTFKSGEQKLYENGVLVGTSHVVGNITTVSDHLYVGKKIGDNFFNGTIDEVRIYNRALTPAEILDLYNLLK